MRSFHLEMSTIDTPTCSTCMEKFPGLKVNGRSECLRCARDKKVPKVYSLENNVHPGPIPTQLQVSITYIRYASKKTLHTVVSRRRRKTLHYTVLSPLLNRCKTAVERPEFAQRRLALKTAVKRSLSPLSPALKRR